MNVCYRILSIMGIEIDQYYLIISSDENNDLYPANTNLNFSIDLPSILSINKTWEVAVTELWIKSSENRVQVDLCADFCSESLINGKFLPFLRRIEMKKGYNHITYSFPHYVALSRSDIRYINFYIKPVNENSDSFIKNSLSLAVHFRKRITGIF